jgi:hypothetical protein
MGENNINIKIKNGIIPNPIKIFTKATSEIRSLS